MDQISETRLSMVCPRLAALVEQLASQLAADPAPVVFRVTQGLRTWDEQARLYAIGRTVPGRKVTDADAGYSWHNYGLAVDVVPFDQNRMPDWNTEHPTWKRIIEAGEALGMVSGSEWRTFPDYPHFQLTGTLPVSPSDEVRQVYKDVDGDLRKIWQLAFPNGTLAATETT